MRTSRWSRPWRNATEKCDKLCNHTLAPVEARNSLTAQTFFHFPRKPALGQPTCFQRSILCDARDWRVPRLSSLPSVPFPMAPGCNQEVSQPLRNLRHLRLPWSIDLGMSGHCGPCRASGGIRRAGRDVGISGCHDKLRDCTHGSPRRGKTGGAEQGNFVKLYFLP